MNNLQTKHKHYNINYKIYTWSISDIAVLTADILDKQLAFFTWLTGSRNVSRNLSRNLSRKSQPKSQRKSQPKAQPKSQPKSQVAT
jgi:hypothetical protein